MPPRGRAGFFCQSGALGSAILEKVNNRGLGLSTFVSAGNRADVSGNDLLQYWEEDESTEVVLLYLESIGNPRKFSRIARRVSLRKPIIAVRSGRTTQGIPMGHAVRQIAAPPAAVDAMFRQAGVIQVDTLEEMFDVAQLLAHQPLPRGRRVAIVGNSDALGLLAADAAAAVGLVVNKSVALGADATAEDFEDALDAAIDDPDVDSVVAVYIPPLNVSGEDVANVLAAVGEQSDKPLVSSFLGAEGVPELLRVPDVAGSTAGRGSVPSYPAVEAAVRALARVVGYAVWLRTPDGPKIDPDEVDPAPAKRLVNEVLAENGDGADLDQDQLAALLGGVRHRSCGRRSRCRPPRRRGRSPEARLGRRAEGDRRAPARAARPGPRLAQHRHPGRDARRVGVAQLPDHRRRARRVRGAEELPAGRTGRHAQHRGPAVRAGRVVRHRRAADRAARGQGVPDPAAAAPATPPRWCARSSPRRCCSATAAARWSTWPPSSELILRVSQLQNDLPQVSSLDLSLVLAGADGVKVLTAAGRVDPVLDPRSDWFVRRLLAHPWGHPPRLAVRRVTDCPHAHTHHR